MAIHQRPLSVLAALLLLIPAADSLIEPLSRRDVITIGTAFTIASSVAPPTWADETIDMQAINAARTEATAETAIDINKITAARSKTGGATFRGVVPITDPPPLVAIRGGKNDSTIKIPRVGYSFYKTAPDQVARCTTLALLSGVRHLDVATQYGTNAEIAKPLKRYLDIGISGLDVREEKTELVELLQATSAAGDKHARETGALAFQSSVAPPPDGSIGRRGRRDGLFIHHKLSNAEQSEDGLSVQKAVKNAIAELGCTYLDMISIHSPLTNSPKRLATYAALLELRNQGFVRSVGVCNYGLGPLKEIADAGLEQPAMNQLELSPFNTHDDIVSWCSSNGVAIGCSAWSKLSSTQGIQDGWLDVVGGISKRKGVTKAQVLIRWAMQKGYTCVPRSAAASRVERVAIAENSYGGVCGFELEEDEMKMLDGLNVSWKAGSLGRRDGWEDSDVSGADWDPTDFV